MEIPAQAGTCTMVGGLAGWNGKSTTPSPSGGQQCVGQGGAVTTPPPAPSFQMAVACGQPDAGSGAAAEGGTATTCQSGQACADMPAGAASDAGMPSGVCVYQSGIQTCPPGGSGLFTNTFIVGAVEDTRGCGCTCGAATCPTDGVVEGYTASGCTGTPSYTGDAGAACNGNIPNNTRPKYVKYNPSKSGSPGACGTATSGPTGTVDIDGGTATTFCCIP
jgi:hypothetical protein